MELSLGGGGGGGGGERVRAGRLHTERVDCRGFDSRTTVGLKRRVGWVGGGEGGIWYANEE